MFPRQFNPGSLSAVVLGASLALVGFNASADAGYRVRSETSPVAITVIDLTPNDGRAAGFTKGAVHYEVFASFSNQHFFDSDRKGGVGLADTLSFQSGTNHTKQSYGPDLGLFASDTTLSIAKHGTSATNANGHSNQFFSLTILPFTKVHLTGTYMLSIERTGSHMAYSTAIASAGMSLNQWSFNDNGVPTNTFNDEYRASQEVFDSSGNQSKSGQFDLAYTNNNPWAETIQYYAFISDSVNMGAIGHEIPAVPEPETYAMLGMGLLVLGATARRRQRRAALQAHGGREPG
ncbi:PEP-CTERM sorting domain-containing protein [Massilia pseudoviolaceinigra]|uniref:PEP-CTERM sorting domain-containing protein n=1 Tax=Massilia pseudoviolaceinigra TaxID=3057165 RepID=UPI0027969B39|nr:PEP-CTERM sorting domain-containing protein [Massilia sp. CCM 9206]MDQ1918877.1 PEP-CTERM sorting domain-containing protein [Massilia sp. CCM 9206]